MPGVVFPRFDNSDDYRRDTSIGWLYVGQKINHYYAPTVKLRYFGEGGGWTHVSRDMIIYRLYRSTKRRGGIAILEDEVGRFHSVGARALESHATRTR